MEQLDIYLTGDSDVCVVVLVGEVDLASADKMRGTLLERLDEAPALLVVELDRVTFLDSVGLNTLVTTYKQAQERGIPFRIAAPSRAARKVLDITSLDTYLPVYPSIDEAKAGAEDPEKALADPDAG